MDAEQEYSKYTTRRLVYKMLRENKIGMEDMKQTLADVVDKLAELKHKLEEVQETLADMLDEL